MRSVYLDTSIFSYLVANPRPEASASYRQFMTKLWWEKIRASFQLVSSDLVLAEIRRGDPVMAARRVALAEDIPVLDMNADVIELQEFYGRELGLSGRGLADIPHIAYCVAHEIDYLLTWDGAHLANPYVQRRLEKLNAELERATPSMCTPDLLMNDPLEEIP